jgi:cell division protein FtsB
MSALDFWWNAVQEDKLDELEQENKKLRQEIDALTTSLNGWVKYFNEKIEKLENERST